MRGCNLLFYLLKVKDHSYVGFCRTRIVGGLRDIIEVHWKNKMLKTCTVVCLVQIIVSKCISTLVCQFCQSKSYQKRKQEIVRLWQMSYMNCFGTLLDFKGTVRIGSVSPCAMSEGDSPCHWRSSWEKQGGRFFSFFLSNFSFPISPFL